MKSKTTNIKPEQAASNKIKQENERITLQFAEKFLQATKLNATLATNMSLCTDDEHSGVIFKLPYSGFWFNDISFITDGDFARVDYSRAIAYSNEELLERADLVSTLRKIANNADYKFEQLSLVGNQSKGICMAKTVHLDNYQEFAEAIGSIDRLISLYIGDTRQGK